MPLISRLAPLCALLALAGCITPVPPAQPPSQTIVAVAPGSVPGVSGVAMGVNYGFEKVRFVSPVRAGRRVRGRFRLEAVTQRSAREYQVRNAVTVEIEGEDKPALIADWLSLYVLA